MSITYRKELFEFVNDLTAISPSIAFEREGDRIIVRKSDALKTMPYIISVPAEYFDIQTTVAFYKYDNFYRYMNTLKTPIIEIDDDVMTLSRDDSKPISIKYKLSDEDGIINGPEEANNEIEWDVSFILTKEDLEEIVKVNGFVRGDKAEISCIDDELTIRFYSGGNDNSFEKVFKVQRISSNDDDFSFIIKSNRFEVIPQKRDYTVNVLAEKFINISLIHDDIDFDIYSGECS